MVLTVCLATLSVVGLKEARDADHDRWTATALHAVISLENAFKVARPLGPGRLQEVLDGFESDGVEFIAVVAPDGLVMASSAVDRIGSHVTSVAFREALLSHEVTTDDNDRTFDVYVPIKRPPPPGPENRPHRKWFHHLLGALDAPKDMVVYVAVTPTKAPLWRWVWMQAFASVAITVLVWLWLFRARRADAQLANLEMEHRRREILARIGEMSAVLAHEIRNPIASMKGHLQLAQESLSRKPESDDLSSRLKTVIEELLRIEELVRGLLDYASDRPLSKTRTKLSELVRNSIDMVRTSTTPEIRLNVSEHIELLCDIAQLSRAFSNIIQNALEAAGSNGIVQITAVVVGNQLVINVEDSGPGIADGLVDRVFEPFVTDKVRGVGLGLAIARRIVEAHGGTLVAGRSSLLKGACFTIRLPISE